MFNALFQALPLRCQLCHLRLDQRNYPWCKTCFQSFPKQPRCQRCGLPTAYTQESCGRCLRKPPLWDRLVCVGDYTFPYDSLLHKFKYKGQYWLSSPLSNLLADNIENPAPILLPVPMHWTRRLLRGFNHSNLLAQALARQLNVNCDSGLLIRTKATPQQQGLTRKKRLSNLKGVFQISSPPPEHVALVDDVVTTGATLAELSLLLRKHGVKHIDVYCIVRSQGK